MLTPNSRLERYNARFPRGAYFLDPHRRFLLCAIPKSGCSSLKRWFLALTDPAEADTPDIHRYCHTTHSLIRHWRKPPDLFCFTMVRDPLRRLASAFSDKFIARFRTGCFEGAREIMEAAARARGLPVNFDREETIILDGAPTRVRSSSDVDYDRGVTFREFIRLICSAPDRCLDSHWRPMSSFLKGQRVDFIGRLDHLAADLGAVSDLLDLPRPARHFPPADHAPVADTLASGDPGALADIPSGDLFRAGILPGAADLFDERLTQLVRSRFAADFELVRTAGVLPQRPHPAALVP